VVFPVPGWPAIMCIFPRASQSLQSHEIGSGLMLDAGNSDIVG
jgi:hypothetical protein